MRHNISRRKLGRTSGHRLALFRNQLASLVAQERIVTTIAKAKELRPLAERMVTQGKRDTVHARRLVGRWIQNRDLIKKLFAEIAPRFLSRPGGYLRIVKLGPRQGDGAEMAILEFVDFELQTSSGKAPSKSKKERAKKDVAEEETPDAEVAAEAAPKKPAKKSAKAKAPAQKAAPKSEAKGKPKAKKASTRSPAVKKTSTPKKIGGT
jgi:large subunit ribosomal protein L17